MISGYVTKLVIEDEGGLPFTLVKPLVYTSKLLDRIIVVPEGFQTDLASIPRALWAVLPPIGSYDRAAVIHDYLYQTDGLNLTRGQADGVLKEAMEVSGTGRFARWTIYAGVRVGGWVPWNTYRKDDHAI